jgi:hypothetical protein
VAKDVEVGMSKPVSILMPEWGTLIVPLIGVSPLIVHKKGDEVAEALLANQERQRNKGSKMQKPREAKNAFREFMAGFHFADKSKVPTKEIAVGESWPFVKGAFGFPAKSFKTAMVRATSVMEGITGEMVKKCIWVKGDIIPLTYSRVELKRDVLSTSGWPPKPDVRHRPMFYDWGVEITVDYLKTRFDKVTILTLLSMAGRVSGAGDDRPGKSGGSFGMWELGKQIKEVA